MEDSMTNPTHYLEDVTFDFQKDESSKCGAHIAYTLSMNGGAASGMNESFLLKAEDTELTEELFKALEQVQVSMSFEDFLTKYMGMYSSDAEMLAMMMGFETEREYYDKTYEGDDCYTDYLEEKIGMFDIMRSKFEDSKLEIDLEDQMKILEVRKSFEDALIAKGEQLGEQITEGDTPAVEAGDVEKQNTRGRRTRTNRRTAQGSKDEDDEKDDDKSSLVRKTKTKKRDNMKEDFEALLKSEDGQALLAGMIEKQVKVETEDLNKAKAALEKSVAKYEAQETERLEKGAGDLFKSLSFLGEDHQEDFVKGVVEHHEVAFVSTLIKHLEAAQEEIETIKKDALGAVGEDVVVQDEVTKSEGKPSDLKKHLAEKYANKEFLK